MNINIDKLLNYTLIGLLLLVAGIFSYKYLPIDDISSNEETETTTVDKLPNNPEGIVFEDNNIKEPSERALKASIGAFILMNDEQRQPYIDEFSENNDTKEAIRNLAMFLDADETKLDKIEKIITSAANPPDIKSQYTGSSDYDTHYSDDYDYSNSFDYESPTYDYSNNNWRYTESSEWDNSDSVANDDINNINIVGGSSSYTQYGNTLYGSEGDTYSRYGNTVYGNDGSTYTQYGNTVYGNDGSTYTQYGNTVYGNDGTSYSTYGNTTYGSDGSTATQYGNTTYLDW